MKAKKSLLLIVLLALALAMAVAPTAFAKSDAVSASGSWTWDPDPNGTYRETEIGGPTLPVTLHGFLKGCEIGSWTGTFAAIGTLEPYVATATITIEFPDDPELPPDVTVLLRAKLWIHFANAAVDMGDGVVLHGDMTMLVIFQDRDPMGATWKIHNGTGDLKHLGGEGTLVYQPYPGTGMDYSGMIWTNK
jgi:hypothetical protein